MSLTNIDFSKHLLSVASMNSEEFECKIYHLYIPNINYDYIDVIVSEGITAVTGDFGNWIFNMEIHFEEFMGFEVDYLLYQLKTSSSQNPYEVDIGATEKEIEKFRKSVDVSLCNLNSEEFEIFCNDLFRSLKKGEQQYNNFIAEGAIHFTTGISIPVIVKKIPFALASVFDAFEVILNRVNNGNSIAQNAKNLLHDKMYHGFNIIAKKNK